MFFFAEISCVVMVTSGDAVGGNELMSIFNKTEWEIQVHAAI